MYLHFLEIVEIEHLSFTWPFGCPLINYRLKSLHWLCKLFSLTFKKKLFAYVNILSLRASCFPPIDSTAVGNIIYV